jgi:magnesium transporter
MIATDDPDGAQPLAAGVPEKNQVRCFVFDGDKPLRHLHDTSQISDILAKNTDLVWLDLVAPTADDLALLREEFSLHPLAIEDAGAAHERPKLDVYDSYWLAIVHGETLDAAGRLVTHEIAIFAGANYLVSIRNTPAYPIEEIERRWGAHWGPMQRTAVGLLYVILDTIVDGYFPVAASLDERLEDLEGNILGKSIEQVQIMERIFTIKRDLQHFRRSVMPMREILQQVLRGDVVSIGEDTAIYYRDIYDHVMRLIEQIDSARDLASNTIDIYLSSVTYRQGEVNKQLTVIATIFLPLTYITGFFGQNFGWMVNGITSPQTFWWLGIGTQVATLAILLAFFKKRGWF